MTITANSNPIDSVAIAFTVDSTSIEEKSKQLRRLGINFDMRRTSQDEVEVRLRFATPPNSAKLDLFDQWCVEVFKCKSLVKSPDQIQTGLDGHPSPVIECWDEGRYIDEVVNDEDLDGMKYLRTPPQNLNAPKRQSSRQASPAKSVVPPPTADTATSSTVAVDVVSPSLQTAESADEGNAAATQQPVEQAVVVSNEVTEKEIEAITVDPEFQSWLLSKSLEEYAALKAVIKSEGIRDALVVWIVDGKIVVIDGHNRLLIAIELGYKTVPIIVMSFADREEVKRWIYHNQRVRRNWNTFQRVEGALRFKDDFAAKAKANQRAGGGAGSDKCLEPVDTNKELAKLAGTSDKTVSRVETILQKASDEDKDALRRGDAGVSINGVFQKCKKQLPSDTEEPTPDEQGCALVKKIRSSARTLCTQIEKIVGLPHDAVELEKILVPLRAAILPTEESEVGHG